MERLENQWQRVYIPQCDPPLPPSETLPDMYDLPSEEVGEPGLPDEYHSLQPTLLSHTFRPPAYYPDQVFTAKDLNLYYDPRYPLRYKRPDWFAVVGVPRLYRGFDLRMSYVRWHEGVDPFVVVEFLSPGTEAGDLGPYYETSNYEATDPPPAMTEASEGVTNGRGTSQAPPPGVDPIPEKWEVYERILKVPYYFVFSRYNNRLRFFKLVGGSYQEQALSDRAPLVWIEELELGLGLWEGEYDGIHRLWLRWCDRNGVWIPTDTELLAQETQRAEQEAQRAEQEARRAEQEARRAEQEAQRAERLAAYLRSQGIDPDEV
ncbi:MAG: Uma2 family endonuclease [Cyanobacteria bacterium]|nr:Uma2 family endonuclease [Cyanobacteriota bacterium]MDW8200305.1 Uma2 family endonuclease [Cyanobacteriota bacterium SKYGB_h_bin112]